MDHTLFYQLTFVLLIAGCIALIVSWRKRPSVIVFILTGLLVGSFGYAKVHALPVFSDLGEIGITLLLFMVGLELDIRKLKELGKVVIYTTLGHVVGVAVIGFFLSMFLHFSAVASVYIAIAITFYSTIIIVKILGEKGQLHTLESRIVIGCSIVEDFIALLILLFIGSTTSHTATLLTSLPVWQTVIITLIRALVFFLGLAFVSKTILPWLLKHLGRSDELLLSFSLAWALGLAAFAALPWVGFSFSIGGFLAGLALANSEVHWEIAARVKSIRDFFIIIFFIVFGSQLALSNIGQQWHVVVLLTAFMIIINPLSFIVLLSWQGYKPKTAFLASLGTIPMSEFSFILIALGFKAGHIDQSIVSVVTLAGIISIACSSYLIANGEKIYLYFRPWLRVFDRHEPGIEERAERAELKKHIVLVGVHRLGQHLIAALQKLPAPMVLVDIDPEIINRYSSLGFDVVCGDITESYIQEQVNLTQAGVIISTIPSVEDNLALLQALKRRSGNKRNKPKLIFAAQNEAEAKRLYDEEIDYALSPHYIGGQHLAKLLSAQDNFKSLKQSRQQHLDMLFSKSR